MYTHSYQGWLGASSHRIAPIWPAPASGKLQLIATSLCPQGMRQASAVAVPEVESLANESSRKRGTAQRVSQEPQVAGIVQGICPSSSPAALEGSSTFRQLLSNGSTPASSESRNGRRRRAGFGCRRRRRVGRWLRRRHVGRWLRRRHVGRGGGPSGFGRRRRRVAGCRSGGSRRSRRRIGGADAASHGLGTLGELHRRVPQPC